MNKSNWRAHSSAKSLTGPRNYPGHIKHKATRENGKQPHHSMDPVGLMRSFWFWYERHPHSPSAVLRWYLAPATDYLNEPSPNIRGRVMEAENICQIWCIWMKIQFLSLIYSFLLDESLSHPTLISPTLLLLLLLCPCLHLNHPPSTTLTSNLTAFDS